MQVTGSFHFRQKGTARHPILGKRSAVVAMDGFEMEIVKGVISAVVMIGAVALVIALLAAMFMIVFSIAVGVDEKLQD